MILDWLPVWGSRTRRTAGAGVAGRRLGWPALATLLALGCTATLSPGPSRPSAEPAKGADGPERAASGARKPQAPPPVAAFLSAMHRKIHQIWGFGVLVAWDAQPASSPLNDRRLVSKLEVVLRVDGAIDKVTVVRPSGHLPFDAEAIDAVYDAAPFAEPPPEMRSANGKIYIHWSFHRDNRQCALDGVDYFVLENRPPTAGAPAVRDATRE